MSKKINLEKEYSKLQVLDSNQKFIRPVIESHCHLDYLKSWSTKEILERCQAVGIEKLITISVEPGNFDSVLAIANAHDNVYCSRGVHPHEAKKWEDGTPEQIQTQIQNEKVVAIGEIGLDYHYNLSAQDQQLEVFEKQLELAAANDMPVIIHSRDSDEDTISMLKKFGPKLKRKGVVHSFTSGPELAHVAIDQGFCLGFNGIITFKNAQNVRDVLAFTPLDRILLETDCPYLTPTPFRGRENAPFYLPFVAEKIMEVKRGQGTDVNAADLLDQVYQNTNRLFF